MLHASADLVSSRQGKDLVSQSLHFILIQSMELKYVISHRFMNSTVTSPELNISRLLWTMLSIISFLHSFYVLFSMRYFSLFPKQLSVNDVKEQIWSYGRDSPTHSNQLDLLQCKGITTLQKIGEVAIQNWSGYNTVLQGCYTELARLRYRTGKLTNYIVLVLHARLH